MIGTDASSAKLPPPRRPPLADAEAVVARFPTLPGILATELTTERVLSALRPIADTAGPSQAASATRGGVARAWLQDRGVLGEHTDYEADVAGSGCDVVRSGRGGLRIVAHLDEISYLIAGSNHGSDGWALLPFCYHLAEGDRPAAVVRHDPADGYHLVSSGTLGGSPDGVHYRPDDGVRLRPGDRVVLRSAIDVDVDSGRVTGSLDNAAGVAAALVAADVLARLRIPFALVLSDEEEGPAGASSQTIARGAARITPWLDATPLTTVVDVHGLDVKQQSETAAHQRPWGASLAEYSSRGRGAVTPPPLFGEIRRLFDGSAAYGVRVTTNVGGHVPRSDDIVATLQSSAVCLLGYPGSDRHFDRGLPAANLADLADLSRALVMLGAAVGITTSEER